MTTSLTPKPFFLESACLSACLFALLLVPPPSLVGADGRSPAKIQSDAEIVALHTRLLVFEADNKASKLEEAELKAEQAKVNAEIKWRNTIRLPTAKGSALDRQIQDLRASIDAFNRTIRKLRAEQESIQRELRRLNITERELRRLNDPDDDLRALYSSIKNPEEAGKNKAEGERFLADNKNKEGVKTTASGLQYKIIKDGTGKTPKATDTVSTHYRGTLINGTEFYSSYKRGEPAEFPVNGAMKGWIEALQLMKEGAKWQLFIPSNLAYDVSIRPGIPQNSALIFDIELLSVKAAQ